MVLDLLEGANVILRSSFLSVLWLVGYDPEALVALVFEMDEYRVGREVPLGILDVVLEVDLVPALTDPTVVVEVSLPSRLLLASDRLDAVNLENLI